MSNTLFSKLDLANNYIILYIIYGIYTLYSVCKMDFTWGFITGIYVVIAIIISYVVYLIEVKLDLPALINGHQSTTPNTQNNNNNNNNNNDNDDFTNISERRLRQLIENIIAETLRVSGLTTGAISDVALNNTQHTTNGLPLTNANGDIRHRHRTEHYFEPKNYQEYLANAVLNKIADKQGNGRLLSESTPDLSAAHVIDRNYNVENQSTTSGSSVEPRSDSSLTDTEQQILTIKKSEGGLSPCGSQQNLRAVDLTALGRDSSLSDYIATHTVPLPDLSAPATESEGDDYVSVTSSAVGVEGTWEDNWLFKKKSSSCAASSVGIVVPSPKEDVRCQIGDKVADEVSDLSELGSDTDDSSIDFLRKKVDPLNDRLLNKHLIGGQNTKLVLDEIIDRASMISNTSVPENEPKYTETKNEYAIQNLNKTEAINSYISQIQTTEGEIKQITQPENLKKPDLGQLKKNDAIGSIAEREYKKWSNAVDMPNNPYAPDALKRRISGSQERFMDLPNISPSTEQNPIDLIKNSNEDETTTQIEQENRENDKKRYSRDYYINDNNEVSSSSNSPKRSTPTTPTVAKTQLNDDVTLTKSDDIIINEETRVIREGNTNTGDTKKVIKRERPLDLPVGGCAGDKNIGGRAAANTPVTPTSTPTPIRGSTPTAFKFLQPKRKLIEPSQVLSFDEDKDMTPEATTPVAKSAIEDEVVHAMPSVKALAQAFLLTSNKTTLAQRRWTAKIKSPSATRSKSPSPSSSIASGALEAPKTDLPIAEATTPETPTTLNTKETSETLIETPTSSGGDQADDAESPDSKRAGFLRSNIAFFENLKFK